MTTPAQPGKGDEPPKVTEPNKQSTTAVQPTNTVKDKDPDPTPVLSAEEQRNLEKALGDGPEVDTVLAERFDAFQENYGGAVATITKLVAGINDDTPDEFIIYGAAGHTIRLGHLRALVTGTAV